MSTADPTSLPLPHVLYESGPCLVVWKPSGVLTQAPPQIDSIELRIKQWIKTRDNAPGKVYLGVPHRLDRAVSGAMVFARHVRACRKLCDQFENRSVRKVYWAVVSGRVEPSAGTWIDWMRKIPERPLSELLSADDPSAQRAVLHYRVLGYVAQGTWLEIELETGRMHQIRLQASSRGHAVLGDELYGSSETFGPPYSDGRLRAIALHGRHLAFKHPMTGENVAVDAPLSVAWRAFELPIGDEAYLALDG